jgi:hypothetical protein
MKRDGKKPPMATLPRVHQIASSGARGPSLGVNKFSKRKK